MGADAVSHHLYSLGSAVDERTSEKVEREPSRGMRWPVVARTRAITGPCLDAAVLWDVTTS